MAITEIGSSYNSSIYESANTAKSNETSTAGTEERTRRTAKDELSYLTQKYECLKSTEYSVNINSSLLAKATSDEKTSVWLEYNLSLIPKVVDSIKSMAAAHGAKVLSCSITMNGYDSMTTEVCVKDEVDPGTEKARKELEERIKERTEEKKAQEEKAAKRREEKNAQEETSAKRREEKNAQEETSAERRAEKKEAKEAGNKTGEYTIRVTSTDIKTVTQKVMAAASGISAPTGASFDIRA